MNCRDFLTEFEERNALTDHATLHLQDCADCRKINVAQTQVWKLIDKFEPVAAPNDFNFRVKAKIADAGPNDFRAASFPVLRYVLGLSIVGLIFAFVIFNGFYSLNDKTVPPIAETNFQPPKQNAVTLPVPPAPEQLAETASTEEIQTPAAEILKPAVAAAVKGTKEFSPSDRDVRFITVKTVKRPLDKNVQDEKPFIGSRDNALSTARGILPKGFENIAPPDKNSPNTDGVGAITAEQILAQLGIESVLENGKRKVKKVVSNSVADRSSVKVGDVIEAIDGETLTSEPIRAKTVEGKSLTVTRGAEKKEILLRN